MDVGAITQIIGSLGFPIVACVALFWLYNKTLTKIDASLKELTSAINALKASKGGDVNGNPNQ